MPPITLYDKSAKSRKERRKEERSAKKKSHIHPRTTAKDNDEKNNDGVKSQPLPLQKQQRQVVDIDEYLKHKISTKTAESNNSKKRKFVGRIGNSGGSSSDVSSDPYYGLDPNIAAALRRDDEEIAMLESKLLLKSKSSGGKKSKDQLQREYAKQEGYGTDFIDFLDDLDTLVQNVVVREDDTRKRKYKTLNVEDTENNDHDDFSDASSEMDDTEHDFDVDTDDDETDDADTDDDDYKNNNNDNNEIDYDDSDSEEIVPMKDPAHNDNYDIYDEENVQNDDDKLENDYNDQIANDLDDNNNKYDGSEYSDEDDESGDEKDDGEEPDHDSADIYQPSTGEDIYGNTIDAFKDGTVEPQKYIPPHLRKGQSNNYDGSTFSNKSKMVASGEVSDVNSDMIRDLQRLLNNALNRLSENTIISVVQTISQMYNQLYPTADINAASWDHIQNACVVNQSTIMTGLIPIYIATFVGIHILKGDVIQLMEYLLEKVVTKFWNELQISRKGNSNSVLEEKLDMDEIYENEIPVTSSSKEISNLSLIICYMYNFGVVHCTLLYDIIRHLIEYCNEIDVEILLLLLNHCGRTLRSDDPNALKEIMTLVQQKQVSSSKEGNMNTSRAQYMVNTLMELKKSKRRKQDQTHADQTLKLRKVLGHIKSNATSKGRTGNNTSSDSSLRITLRDILDVETKGRWWKVGASWAGGNNTSQLLHGEDDSNTRQDSRVDRTAKISSETDDVLLQLAAKYRMNTDTRRTIFCIVMGGSDYEDCFEKLVRAGMIKNRFERDTVRVLMECCCNEKTFNPYYAHLAARICDYQPQCKFTFQLAYWDTFKQLGDYKPRKVANLAKLLYHLVAVHQCLKLNVIKVLDIAAPEQLSESALIFVTIFLSSVMEHYDSPEDTFRLFKQGTRYKKGSPKDNDNTEDDMYEGDNNGIQASITIFLVQVLKASPKYVKGSKFRTNLKAAIKACDTDSFV